MDPKVAVWFTFAAVVIGAVVSSLRPDNTSLPFTLSTGMRASVALALGATQTCLMAIVSGVPWLTALGTATASVITAFLAHGAPHVPDDGTPVPKVSDVSDRRGFVRVRALLIVSVLGVLGSASLPLVGGCKLLFPNGVKSAVSDADKLCIIANAAFPSQTIATICGIEGDVSDIIKIVDAVAEPERARLAAAHRAGVVEGLQRAGVVPLNVDGGR
jgi:hypothetical protein